MNPSTKTTTLIGILVVLIIVAGLLLSLSRTAKEQRMLSIQSYDDCVRAGYPVMESYPSQCRTPDGRLFVNPNESVASSTTSVPSAPASGACVPAGCSQTICADANDAQNIVTTCEYRADYACYKTARCERQADGKCGWTQTTELASCLAHPPALDSGAMPQ